MSASYLLHPDVLEHTPVFGSHAARVISKDAAALESRGLAIHPVSIVLRTKNDAPRLEQLFDEIDNLTYLNEVEVLVVDTESTDGTAQTARRLGAGVINIKQEDFTYPRALNRGFEAASYEQIFTTVGHANFSNTQTLRAVAKHLTGNTAGVFGLALPGLNASRTERYFAGVVWPQLRTNEHVKKTGLGVLAATGAAVARSAWEELGGFDERYAAGGEDAALAGTMLKKGYNLIRNPLLAVHHSHGLGPINSIRQIKHWMSISKPQDFDVEKVASRRPDLKSKLVEEVQQGATE